MPHFDTRFYSGSNPNSLDLDGYRTLLHNSLNQMSSATERDILLRQEVVAITRHITDGVRDLITRDKRIRNLVLNQGAVPLATWSVILDTLADHSISSIRQKIAEMQRDLEHGKVGGFPGTMFLYGKPTFTIFEPFYELVFSLAEENAARTD